MVRTAEELQEAVEAGARDIVVHDHIDARGLPLTEAPQFLNEYLQPAPCLRSYGEQGSGCDAMLYLTGTRSLRVRCPATVIHRYLKIASNAIPRTIKALLIAADSTADCWLEHDLTGH